jgi:tetratricopeptide (TPR) repeat protein
MQKTSFLLIIILLGTLLFYSCGEKEVTRPTARELIDQGWQKFQAGNLVGAGSDFTAALSISSVKIDSSDAYLGLGWAQLRYNQGGLAENSLVKYLSFGPGLPELNDGRAGLAFAYLSTDKFAEAIDTANVVLSSNASWSFGRDNSINHLDLRLLLAQCYYNLGDYSASLEIVRYFDSGFNVDINTPEGRSDLADEIHSLWTG